MQNIIYIIIGIIIIIALWLITVYNGLIRMKNRVDEGWSDIDVQLKRRFDLIPNLVETVKGYASHEKELFENVTRARTNAMQAGSVENYPELKASENFLKLQDELSDTENKIQAARRFYNGLVRDFNTKIQVFPTNIIATKLGFQKRDFFEIEEAEKENVKVEF